MGKEIYSKILYPAKVSLYVKVTDKYASTCPISEKLKIYSRTQEIRWNKKLNKKKKETVQIKLPDINTMIDIANNNERKPGLGI